MDMPPRACPRRGLPSMPGNSSRASIRPTMRLQDDGPDAPCRPDPPALLPPALTAETITGLMDGLTVRPMSASTIEMLRFAAGSAASPPPGHRAVARPVEPVVTKKPVRGKIVTETDWKAEAMATTMPRPLPWPWSMPPVPLPAGDGTPATVPVAATDAAAPLVGRPRGFVAHLLSSHRQMPSPLPLAAIVQRKLDRSASTASCRKSATTRMRASARTLSWKMIQ